MPTLDRYLYRQLLDYFMLALAVLSLIAFFSDTLLDFLREIQKLGVSGNTGFTLIGLQLPRTISFVLPASTFIAVLLVFSALNQNFEITAMRMSGISLFRLATPALVLGLITAGVAYWLGDYVVPYCNERAELLMNEAVRNGSLPAGTESLIFKNADEDNNLKQLIYVGQAEGSQLANCTILDLSTPGVLQVIQAKQGKWHPTRWEFNSANAYTVSNKNDLLVFNHMNRFIVRNILGQEEEQEAVAELEDEENGKEESLSIKTKTQSFAELYHLVQARKEAGRKTVKKTIIKMWERLTMPLSTFFMILSAVALALNPPRRGVDKGFILAVAVMFGFYLLRSVSVAMGTSGQFQLGGLIDLETSLFIAAWLPLVLIGLIGLGLMIRKSKLL